MDTPPYINQLSLIKKGVEQNRQFLRLLWTATGFEGVHRQFDRITEDSIFNPQGPDAETSLDDFVLLLSKKSMIQLRFASPEPDRIDYCAQSNIDNEWRLAWVIMPYTKENLVAVAHQYETAFGERLLDVPADKSHLEGYLWRVRTDGVR